MNGGRVSIAVGALLVTLLGAALWQRAHSFIETLVEVDAVPKVVLQVLTDFGSCQEWNPSLVGMSGEDVPGRTPRAVPHRLAEQQHAS